FPDYVGPMDAKAKELAMTAASSQPLDDTPTATQPASQPADIAPVNGRLRLSVADAILVSLEHNQGLVVNRYRPPIVRTQEDVQRAVFDPMLSGEISSGRTWSPFSSPLTTTNGFLTLSEYLPTGTNLQFTAGGSDFSRGTDNANLDFTVTQSLLKGFGLDVNLASLRQAKLDTVSSQYELRGFAQSLVAQVEDAYWDYVLATKQLDIFQKSYELAKQQRDETLTRIEVGKLAPTEAAAAEAEVALRYENLINNIAAIEALRIRLLQLINPNSKDLWNTKLDLTDQTSPTAVILDTVDDYVAYALRMRPDMNQARLQVERGDLEIVKTRNGLLPQLDFFVSLGRTGYAKMFNDAVSDLDGKGHNIVAGLSGSYPLLNRAAKAQDQRAHLSRDQSAAALENLAQTVQVDVRTAYVNVNRLEQQIKATAATSRLQLITYQAEVEKFNLGKSTSFLVAQAQRDLVSAQINEVQAQVAYLKSLVDLHLLDGSLLERRGITAPGDQTMKMQGEKAAYAN
ncbi:MAG: TolC family protein, partial [Planctomycetaceae bacterium]